MRHRHPRLTQRLPRSYFLRHLLPNLRGRVTHHPLVKSGQPRKKSTTPTSATPSPLPQRPDNPFLNCFIKAITKSGPSRTPLMTKVNGDVFYKWRALHFQHTYGNITEVHPQATVMRQLNSREKECWGELEGMVRQDAFADLLRHCNTLRQEHPKLFD